MTAAAEHRVIVRDERGGSSRTYCYCGWASQLGITRDEMTAEVYAHLGHSIEPAQVARPAARGDVTLF